MSPLSALAQQTVNVLVDASFAATGKRFLDEMQKNLAPEARASISLKTMSVTSSQLSARLRDSGWEMAIVSTAALTAAQIRTTAAAFEMPFVFPSSASAIKLQQSPLGRAALGTMSTQGITGLVYLNDGVSLIVARTAPRSPNDLKGRKIAVFSSAQQQALRTLGSSPVVLPTTEAFSALERGAVDSALISSARPVEVRLPDQQFLLADSIRAQVAIVVTRNASWDGIPFVYRAMIGDAAVSAAQQMDDAVVQAENSLFREAQASGTFVTFERADAERGTRQWIGAQPVNLQGHYSSVLDGIKNLNLQTPPPAPTPKKGSQAARIYFATTREDTGNSSFQYRFGDKRTGVTKCGQVVFSHSQAASLTFDGPVIADSVACGAQMNAVLKSSKRMLLFVHGFNNRFAEASERAVLLKQALGDETEVLLWSWPSKRDGLTGNYDYDKESVSGAARQNFSRLLRAMKSGTDSSSLDILAHSMGGWHTIGVLRDLVDDMERPALGNVALAAPDVPTDEFEFALNDMRRIAGLITLYACASDLALALSQGINAFPRAGTGGQEAIVVDKQLDSVDVEAKFLSTNHSYVFEAGKVLEDLTTLVRQRRDAAGRGLRQQPKPPWHFWTFD